MTSFHFADPWLLLVALGAPLIVWMRLRQERRRRSSMRFSDLGILAGTGRTLASRLWWLPSALRAAAVIVLAVAFARPQAGHAEEEMLTHGIDIVIALDHSTSMAAEDFRPKNRLAAAKESATAFVRGRRSDRIGLVVFAGSGWTACPLTLDEDVLLQILGSVDLASRDDGTAIGMGLAMAINRLRGSDAASKVIVLVTDGRNNRGEIDPTTAASLARTLGVKIYTIGVGTRGEVPYPVEDPVLGRRYIYLRADIDEESLQGIAAETGGRYFRATDTDSLRTIFAEIDALEKSEIRVRHYMLYTELFPWFAWTGLGIFLVETILSSTRLRRLP